MNSNSVHNGEESGEMYIELPLPVTEPAAFTHTATAEILHVLAENPGEAFSNRELHRLTGRGLGNVNAAVESLGALGLVRIQKDGRANQVRIDDDALVRPSDPVTIIPQSAYHQPVREILTLMDDRLDTEVGVVLFGSVARGDADRASDIDLFVVVPDDRMQAQHAAHEIEDEVASMRFDGDRYEPHIVVESRETAARHDRIREILSSGLVLEESDALTALTQEVAAHGA